MLHRPHFLVCTAYRFLGVCISDVYLVALGKTMVDYEACIIVSFRYSLNRPQYVGGPSLQVIELSFLSLQIDAKVHLLMG